MNVNEPPLASSTVALLAGAGVGLGVGDFVAVPPGVDALEPHAATTTDAPAARKSERRFIANDDIVTLP